MTMAIVQHQAGGPEVLRWEKVSVPAPGPGQARIRQTAVGLNYIDVYHREGRYPIPAFPVTIGMEAAGVVESVGEDVTGLQPGDRVAYATQPMGAYAQARVINATRLVPVPEGISDQQAATLMQKGMTAAYLLTRTHPVQPGEVVLVQAAAGGMGLYLSQWAKALGAVVVGTVSTPEKAELAKAHGCDHVINYTREDFAARIKEITNGRGCDVIYDGVGKKTILGSLDALAILGHMVSYGGASGPVDTIEMGALAAKSLNLSRPSLYHHTARPEDLNALASAVFDAVAKGWINPEVRQTYPLQDAAQAHEDLQARRTTGATVLIP